MHSEYLQARHLTYYRGERLIINQVSFSLAQGECVHITGDNGAGKTTLLRMLTGILTPHSGDILWQGQSIHKDRLRYQQQFYYLGHHVGIKDDLTVLENLHWEHNKKFELLEMLQLHSLQNVLARHLSNGQRQRVALAKLMASSAPLWIMDEPFASLDAVGMQKVQAMLLQKLQCGGGVILTSHPTLTQALSPKKIHLPTTVLCNE